MGLSPHHSPFPRSSPSATLGAGGFVAPRSPLARAAPHALLRALTAARRLVRLVLTSRPCRLLRPAPLLLAVLAPLSRRRAAPPLAFPLLLARRSRSLRCVAPVRGAPPLAFPALLARRAHSPCCRRAPLPRRACYEEGRAPVARDSPCYLAVGPAAVLPHHGRPRFSVVPAASAASPWDRCREISRLGSTDPAFAGAFRNPWPLVGLHTWRLRIHGIGGVPQEEAGEAMQLCFPVGSRRRPPGVHPAKSRRVTESPRERAAGEREGRLSGIRCVARGGAGGPHACILGC